MRHHVDEEVQRVGPFLRVELGLPLFVKPAGAERIRHRRDEGAAFTPTRLAAQADAIDFVVAVGHRDGRFANEVPRWRVGHFEAGRFHEIGAIHDHRAFAVERRRIKRAFVAESARHGWQDVVNVIGVAQIIERNEPAIGAPDRGFVHADGHDVESAAFGGDVGRHALAKNILFQRDPLDVDAGRRGELIRVALHADHVAVVHGRDGDCLVLRECCGRTQRQRRRDAN